MGKFTRHNRTFDKTDMWLMESGWELKGIALYDHENVVKMQTQDGAKKLQLVWDEVKERIKYTYEESFCDDVDIDEDDTDDDDYVFYNNDDTDETYKMNIAEAYDEYHNSDTLGNHPTGQT